MTIEERHIMPVPGEHIAAGDCWCRPTSERVGQGVLWTHRVVPTERRLGDFFEQEAATWPSN